MIFAFKYMYMLLGYKTLINSFLHKLFLNKRVKIQDGCQSFPIIAATKIARGTLTFLKLQVLSPKMLKQTVCVRLLWQILV